MKKSNYTNCIYFDRETISLKWCNLHVSVNYNKNLLFFVWCRKDKFWILFFLSTFVLFSVKGSVVSLFAPAIIPDSESDTEGSTRTMMLLKLHYHQQQVSNWSLFCTIFETNKQTKNPTLLPWGSMCTSQSPPGKKIIIFTLILSSMIWQKNFKYTTLKN